MPTVNKCTEGENEEDTCFAASSGFKRDSDFLVVALCHWVLKVLDSTFGKQFNIADLERVKELLLSDVMPSSH